MHALAIDLGTTAAKVGVVALDGTVCGTGTRVLQTTFGPGGAAEQDPSAVWSAVVDAARDALAAAGPDTAADVAVVCATSQWSSIVPVASDGTPVGPLMMWFDRRGSRESGALMRGADAGDVIGRWADIHGMVPSGALGHVLYVQRHRPEIAARAAAYVEPMDYLNARLTGRVTATANSVMPLSLTDNRTLGAVRWSDELVGRAGVDASKLAPLVPGCSVVGPLQAEVADALGVPRATVAVASANDSIAAALGTGALEDGEGTVVMGTTGVLTAHHRVRVNRLEQFVLSMPSALDDRYYVVAEAGMGGRVAEQVLGSMLAGSFDELDALAGTAEAGAGGVMFLPWLTGSLSPAPNDRLRGGFVGLSLSTTRADLMRALLEGISMQMRWLADAVDALTGTPFETMRFGGGGAQSDTWAQIMADVLGRPIEQIDQPRFMNTRGAGFLAFLSVGALSLADLPALVPVRARYEPAPGSARLHTERLAVHQDLHARLAEPSRRLRPVSPEEDS